VKAYRDSSETGEPICLKTTAMTSRLSVGTAKARIDLVHSSDFPYATDECR